MVNRRSFLVGLIAAPVVIRPGILMPIKVIDPVKLFTIADYQRLIEITMNNRIKEFQDKLANQILYGTPNVHYFGDLVFYVKDLKKVRVDAVTSEMVYK